MGRSVSLETKSPATDAARSSALRRGKPRAYREWAALRRWGKLPAREMSVAGYLLRETREKAGMTQSRLAEALGISQQAVAQAERWEANPTFEFAASWARACDREFDPVFRTQGGNRKAECGG